jgi:phage terminase large subunit
MLISFNGASASKVSAKSLVTLKKQAVKSGKIVRVYGYQTKLINGRKTVSLNRAKAVKAALLKINKNLDVRVVAAGATKNAKCKSVKNNCVSVVFSNK